MKFHGKMAKFVTGASVLVLIAGLCRPCPANAVELYYSGHGGQGSVSGSMHVLHVDENKYIVDVGLFMDGDGDNHPWPEDVPVDSIRAVFITHAHADHVGRLPLLFREGYRGPVYMTEVTLDIVRKTLPGNLRWADFGVERFYYSRHHKGKSRIPVYLEGYDFGKYTVLEKNRIFIEMKRSDLEGKGFYLQSMQVKKLMDELLERLDRQVRVLHPGQTVGIDGVVVEFINTSHIPGSVMVAFSAAERDLLFTGDVGSDGSPLLNPTLPLMDREIDYAWFEGTYDSPRCTDYERERRRFCETIGELVEGNYRVVIPAFVLDRTQQVLFEISRAMEEGVIPAEAPVKVYSASANEITRLYRRWAADPIVVDRYFSDAMKVEWFSTPAYQEPKVNWGSADPLRLGYGEIGIMSSGMAEHSFARRAVLHYGADTGTVFYFVSYLAPGTPGWQMVNGASSVTVPGGKRVSYRAKSHVTGAFSSHADPEKMLKIFGRSKIGKLFLVHVDPGKADILQSFYRENLGVPVHVPEPGEMIRLR